VSKVAWSSVSEVPGLPFKTYEELVKSEKHGFAVDPGRGRELAFHLAGRVGRLGLLSLQLLPYVMVAVSIIAALFTGHYRLLLGIPIAVVTFFFANPMNPLKSIVSMGSKIGAILLLLSILSGNWVNAWLLASAVLTFFGIRRLYSSSIRVVQAAARRSESIFLWLYFNRICAIQDRQSGELTAYRA